MNIMDITFMLTLFTLALPLIALLYLPKTQLILNTKTAVKTAFFISLIPLLYLYWLNPNPTKIFSDLTMLNTSTFNIKLNLIFDHYSLMFMPIALFVTWAIMEYSHFYMATDPHIEKFFKFLLIFLMAMMILVTSNNLPQFFIGWEGVGMMSFLLIGWWQGRAEANSSALMAIIYNRTGDIGLILSMAWMLMTLTSLNFQQFTTYGNPTPLLPLLGFILAATGKSAQFGLHPWLPAAMEGPTPVSALLHSSTMVVAGIFLLIRVHPLMATNKWALSICLCLGAITAFSTSLCALTQNDLKKIIAYSTSSQLGLMMVTIGLNQPKLAFLHISMHAFFKAMLFLCAGYIIHSLNDEQDIRKMGGLHKPMPITSTCLTIGNMALMGMPFLTGYYSKDIIIETMSTSYLNAWALLLTLMATSFTAVYTLRITMLVQTGHPKHPLTMYLHENIPMIMNPIIRLASGSIVAGPFIALSTESLKTPMTTMPVLIKMAALTVTIIGFMMGLKLTSMVNKMPPKPSNTHNSIISLIYFNPLIHRTLSKTHLKLSQKTATHSTDQSWYENIGPKGLTKLQIPPTKFTSSSQKGLIKIYMISFLLTMLLALMLTTLM
uniref:NADH dehydrogenase subunit 5 n=1 Tax=Terrapene carolina TaxID=158814 RepID=UPI0022F2DF56|nr:NADH dehydrogenase subunit 5 [Terrapene carolina]WAJ60751.1 NADH dehydrogenase subunit 5 [Terrapene carolina]